MAIQKKAQHVVNEAVRTPQILERLSMFNINFNSPQSNSSLILNDIASCHLGLVVTHQFHQWGLLLNRCFVGSLARFVRYGYGIAVFYAMAILMGRYVCRSILLFLIGVIFSFTHTIAAANPIQVSPVAKTDWTYRFVRCDTWHGPYSKESEAITTGMNTYYGCGPSVADPGAWGTAENPQPGPCGSTNYHPDSTWDFSAGIEVYNTRNISIKYCSSTDGLTIDRTRTAGCPDGYNLVAGNVCQLVSVDPYKNPGPPCPNGTNPINGGTGNKFQEEKDYAFSSIRDGIGFTRYYNSAVRHDGLAISAGLGNRWGHTYSRSTLFFGNASIQTVAVRRPDGKVYFFNYVNGLWQPTADISDTLAQTKDAANTPTGWRYTTLGGTVEIYDIEGRLLTLTSRLGVTQTLIYSDANTPATIARVPGLLIQVTDSFGHSLHFTYDTSHRIATMADPIGGTYTYGYDASGNLTAVTYPDTKVRTYVYGELVNTSNVSRPYALTGIIDENNIRFATYQYDTQGRATSSEHAGGAEKYQLAYSSPDSTVITNPAGNAIIYKFANVLGVVKDAGQNQPAGAGCSASASNLTNDTNGNIASRTDFNGNLSCFAYDLSRNLETSRIEGIAPGGTCPADVAAYAPAANTVERKITTAWHPDWRLEMQRAEPKKLITWVYSGQPDPSNANTAASCAPATALLPDGSPIAVLCKKIEQATTDLTGASGLSATPTGPARVWSYTYNGPGQVLTADGPRTDVTDVTTYTYYTDTAASHRVGDLASVTDAAGHLTQYTSYDAVGRPLTIVDANGVTTTYTYYPRGWLKSHSVGPGGGSTLTTRYVYDGVGQLKTVTPPDGAVLTYSYDAAHRLTGIADNLGNTVTYLLDAMGNRKDEHLKDPSGTLTRRITRVYDALNRLQTITGAVQ